KYSDSLGLSRRAANVNSSPSQRAINFTVNNLIHRIRKIDPTFRYRTIRAVGPAGRLNQNDITALQQFLSNAQIGSLCAPAEGSATRPLFPNDPSQISHIFRNSENHVNPTFSSSRNRYIELFRNTASNPANLDNTRVSSGARAAGIEGFTQNYNNGQVWVHIRNGSINNAGVNRNE
ncbi:hypothetical protein, partial [Aurantivibrio infirmus]